ncbi:hypothetical protein LEN26_003415 [Aphanomyces euteiches]|nr:hypothetical protein AeMF1_014211 [Aphanomyces euteiches]KAH9154348.1 hypothetical protein LEN26_003415 [Aphanomyces euteiches]KAH9182362.1 hypothetical protein AeNC1_015662 [Aphanomyces euteiches]
MADRNESNPQPRSHPNIEYDPDGNVVLVDGESQFRRQAELKKYMRTIQGNWYEKLYFSISGVIIALILGTLIAFAIDRGIDTKSVYEKAKATMVEAVAEMQRLYDMSTTKKEWGRWIGLPGIFFVRALNLFTVPYIFVSVIVGVADLCQYRKAKYVVWRYILLSFLTTFFACMVGFGLIMMPPKDWFKHENALESLSSTPEAWGVVCPPPLVFGTNSTSKKLGCFAAMSTVESISQTSPNFYQKSHVFQDVAFDNIYNLTLDLIPETSMNPFVDANGFHAVVILAIIFGIALGTQTENREEVHKVLQLLSELHRVFLQIIRWIVATVPVAVTSLVATSFVNPADNASITSTLPSPSELPPGIPLDTVKAIVEATQTTSSSFFVLLGSSSKLMGLLFVVYLVGMAIHCCVVLPIITHVAARRSAFSFMFGIKHALAQGFGSASSIAALEPLIQAIDETRTVSKELADAVIPVGTTMHLDGAAFYLCVCCIFLMRVQGLTIDAGKSVVLLLTAIVSSWSCPPIPGGGITVLAVMWASINGGLPTYLSWIVAMDVLLDRFSTVMSLFSNAIVVRIIAEQIDETYVDEVDRRQGAVSSDEDDD